VPVVIVGTNHRLAPIALRERLAVQEERLPFIFGSLRENLGASEVAVLSTCNRVELYACVTDVDGSVKRMQGFLSSHGGIELPKLREHSFHHTSHYPTRPHHRRHQYGWSESYPCQTSSG